MPPKRIDPKIREQLKKRKEDRNKLDKLIKVLIQKNLISLEDLNNV